MSDEESKSIEMLNRFITEHKLFNIKQADNLEDNIRTILNIIEKQQKEIKQLKQSIVKATEIIDEYANETENDTKKIIEYQEKYLDN